MTENEVALVKMIRESKHPNKALLIAIQTIQLILKQH